MMSVISSSVCYLQDCILSRSSYALMVLDHGK